MRFQFGLGGRFIFERRYFVRIDTDHQIRNVIVNLGECLSKFVLQETAGRLQKEFPKEVRRLPAKIDVDQMALLKGLDHLKRSADSSGMLAGMDAFSNAAFGVLTSNKLADALDLTKEDPRILARYGDAPRPTGTRFGPGRRSGVTSRGGFHSPEPCPTQFATISHSRQANSYSSFVFRSIGASTRHDRRGRIRSRSAA